MHVFPRLTLRILLATPVLVGPAIQAAAEACQQLLDAAATFLEVPADRLSVRDGQVWIAGEEKPTVAVADVTGRIAPHMIFGQGRIWPRPCSRSMPRCG